MMSKLGFIFYLLDVQGHMSKDCSKPQVCKRCGEEGHMVRECSQEEKTRQMTDEEGKVGTDFSCTDKIE